MLATKSALRRVAGATQIHLYATTNVWRLSKLVVRRLSSHPAAIPIMPDTEMAPPESGLTPAVNVKVTLKNEFIHTSEDFRPSIPVHHNVNYGTIPCSMHDIPDFHFPDGTRPPPTRQQHIRALKRATEIKKIEMMRKEMDERQKHIEEQQLSLILEKIDKARAKRRRKLGRQKATDENTPSESSS